MSKLKAKGNDSGTGVFTLETPPTNTDRTLTLPDTTGTLVDTTGATFTGGVTGTDVTLSGGLYVGGTGSANHLDDYEEGTWTPTFLNVTGVTYDTTQTVGRYTKIGNMVSYSLVIKCTAKDSSGNQVRIGGLPFTTSNSDTSAYSASSTWVEEGFNATSGEGYQSLVMRNDTSIRMYYVSHSTGTNSNNLVYNHLHSTARVRLSGVYFI